MKKEQYLGVNVITLNYDEIIEDIKKRMEEELNFNDHCCQSRKGHNRK